jgi:hypothetical protein
MPCPEQMQSINKIESAVLLKKKFAALRIALALAASTGIGYFHNTPSARAGSQDCGAVLVADKDWLQGHGVDVHSNGVNQGTGTSCHGDSEIYDYSIPSSQFGWGWQCVELFNRLYHAEGWYGQFTLPSDAQGAKNLYPEAYAGHYGKTIHAEANGSGYIPVPGDAIILSNASAGHVAIVDHIDGTTLYSVAENDVDENGNPAGMVKYTFDPQTGAASRERFTTLGYIHSDDNHLLNPTNGGDVPFSMVPENGVSTDGNWVYDKVGGSAWPVKPKSEWTASDASYWNSNPVNVSTEDIHNHEVGYSQNGRDPGVHPPRDGTDVYIDGGNGQQYYFLNGQAYPITTNEIDDLGIRNKAVRIPATGNRLSDFTQLHSYILPNRSLYRFAGNSRVSLISQHPDGSEDAYYVNNDTVLDCLEFTEGQTIRILPQAARPYLYDNIGRLVPELSQPAACSFPSGMILRGPGGLEQWRITGDNSGQSYVRHYYPNALLTYLHTNGHPDLRVMRSVGAINNVPQGNDIIPPQGAFFRSTTNLEVFESVDGIYKKVPTPDTLICLGNPSIIDVPGSAMEGMPQSGIVTCGYSNRIIYGPDGVQYYVDPATSKREIIGNTAISSCIQVRRGTSTPVPVSAGTINDYALDSKNAWCYYEGEPGLNFVREQGDNTVWLVDAGGVKHHAGSLCPNPSNLKRWNIYQVPAGETAGHVQGSDWFASQVVCDALPG